MLDTTKKTLATLTAAACLGGGGWAIAADSSPDSSAASGAIAATSIAGTATTPGQVGAPPQGQPPQQTPVTGATADTISTAITAKVPGATIDRIEKDANGYHAHITKSDGTRARVVVNAQLQVTDVQADNGPGGPGGPGRPGGPKQGETPLTGDTAAKAKAAALAKVPGATVDRVETDVDGDTYEAHITTSDGSRATVKLDADFNVTGVEKR